MKKIDLFCGISSLGIPFPRENKNHIGFLDLVQRSLIEKGYSVDAFNLSSLNKNHTWDLAKIITDNYNMLQIKNIQINSIESLRNTNLLFKLIVPKDIKKKFSINENDENINYKDALSKSVNPIFIYSGGQNDFFSYIKAGPVELIDKNVRNNLPDDLDSLVYKCIENVEKNWIMLHSVNPNIEILALGFYYSSLYDKIQRIISLQEKKKIKVNRFEQLINLYNLLLLETSKKYDFVKFIDISFVRYNCAPMDFHPDTKGNELIAEAVLKNLNYDIIKHM